MSFIIVMYIFKSHFSSIQCYMIVHKYFQICRFIITSAENSCVVCYTNSIFL